MTTRIVLDSNVAAFWPLGRIAELGRHGLPISISEVVLSETWARSTRSLSEGTPLEGARGKLFSRFSRLAPFIDTEYPVAVGGAMGVERAQLLANPWRAPSAELVEYVAHTKEVWSAIIDGNISDEEWIRVGQETARHLADADRSLRELIRPVEEKLVARYPDEEERRQLAKQLRTTPADALRTYTLWAIREGWGFDIADRIDALVRVTAWRSLHPRDDLARPRENDGADHRLLIHLGEGALVLTDEQKLCRLVDASGTPQAPWVRRAIDFAGNELPSGNPWGDSALEQAARFKRSGLLRHPLAWPFAVPPYGPLYSHSLATIDEANGGG